VISTIVSSIVSHCTQQIEQPNILPFQPPAEAHHDAVLAVLRDIAESLRRLADAHTPPLTGPVGTPYVARKMGCTTTHVGQLARDGDIPPSCVVLGTGTGKPWKFHREQIDEWIAAR
jgi:hypothetical protein